jgi:hypothetical protein
MTNKLRAFLLTAAVSLGLGAVTPARALIALPNPSDFVFIESVNGSSGTYTIENNSADWYIWAFSVTNTNATDPSTTQFHWNAGPCDNNCAGVPSGAGLDYQNGDGAFVLSTDIGPGQSSSLFFFSPPAGTTPTFLVTNANDALPPGFTPTGSPVPEPSTWAMLIAGFGFLGWRYSLQRGGLRRLFDAA